MFGPAALQTCTDSPYLSAPGSSDAIIVLHYPLPTVLHLLPLASPTNHIKSPFLSHRLDFILGRSPPLNFSLLTNLSARDRAMPEKDDAAARGCGDGIRGALHLLLPPSPQSGETKPIYLGFWCGMLRRWTGRGFSLSR
uniref:Uncharacterized protein n=4 Tax=Aegilops tauschii subsp. strangulata TaxID=200361 RepID=A0A453NHH2_AEGTS